jgi:5'-phosphate synthase pdxT subunit
MLQGARHAHVQALNSAANELNIPLQIFELRKDNDLLEANPDAIILPGGESSPMRLIGNGTNSQLLPKLFELIRKKTDLPVMGTCAGAILLSDPQDEGDKIVDAIVDRNAYGSQSESFQSTVDASLISRDFLGIFIRAPRFLSLGENSTVIVSHGEEIVGARTNNRIALTFHPELSNDNGFHKWLISKALEVRS